MHFCPLLLFLITCSIIVPFRQMVGTCLLAKNTKQQNFFFNKYSSSIVNEVILNEFDNSNVYFEGIKNNVRVHCFFFVKENIYTYIKELSL